VYSQSGHLKSMKKSLNLTSWVFWVTKINSTPTPVSEAQPA